MPRKLDFEAQFVIFSWDVAMISLGTRALVGKVFPTTTPFDASIREVSS